MGVLNQEFYWWINPAGEKFQQACSWAEFSKLCGNYVIITTDIQSKFSPKILITTLDIRHFRKINENDSRKQCSVFLIEYTISFYSVFYFFIPYFILLYLTKFQYWLKFIIHNYSITFAARTNLNPESSKTHNSRVAIQTIAEVIKLIQKIFIKIYNIV